MDMGESRERTPRWVLRAMDGLVALSIVLVVLAFVFDPLEIFLGAAHLTVSKGVKPVLITVLLVVMRWLAAWRGPGIARGVGRVARSPWFAKPTLAVGSVVVFIGVAEGFLAWRGFEAELPPLVIAGEEGAGPVPASFMIPDRELRWKLNPGVEWNGRPVNAMGFFDREVDEIKAPGAVRVICMGDSCSAQGIPPYSGFLHERLGKDPVTDAPWESFNMAVHGYSSIQGLALFRLRTRNLAPDYVSLYYGWNDHWLGGKPDSNIMALRMNPVAAQVFETLRDLRLFQFMVRTLNPVRNFTASEGPELGLRVPQSEYEWALRQFISEIRAIDAVPILLTAPRAETLAAVLVKNGQTKKIEDAIERHDEYVEITRRVAGELDVPLLDLAAMFSGPENAALFSGDGIHLQRQGRIRIAAELYGLLEELAGDADGG